MSICFKVQDFAVNIKRLLYICKFFVLNTNYLFWELKQWNKPQKMTCSTILCKIRFRWLNFLWEILRGLCDVSSFSTSVSTPEAASQLIDSISRKVCHLHSSSFNEGSPLYLPNPALKGLQLPQQEVVSVETVGSKQRTRFYSAPSATKKVSKVGLGADSC